MNHFPDDRVLWAGLGNNPPPESPYWREQHAIDHARQLARIGSTWSEYCRRFGVGLVLLLREAK